MSKIFIMHIYEHLHYISCIFIIVLHHVVPFPECNPSLSRCESFLENS